MDWHLDRNASAVTGDSVVCNVLDDVEHGALQVLLHLLLRHPREILDEFGVAFVGAVDEANLVEEMAVGGSPLPHVQEMHRHVAHRVDVGGSANEGFTGAEHSRTHRLSWKALDGGQAPLALGCRGRLPRFLQNKVHVRVQCSLERPAVPFLICLSLPRINRDLFLFLRPLNPPHTLVLGPPLLRNFRATRCFFPVLQIEHVLPPLRNIRDYLRNSVQHD
mmetsp:Transcript_12991/g.25940  ORF Transcript_12991/g.25940 Transcript_12991/m.25940 type:complete len:220 (+) Transcript_12991:208-867(+)